MLITTAFSWLLLAYTKLTIVVVDIWLNRVVTFTGESELAVFLLVIQQSLQLGKHLPTVAAYQYVWIAWALTEKKTHIAYYYNNKILNLFF